MIHREDSLAPDPDGIAAESLHSNGVVRLAQLETLADWHRTFARVGRSQYEVAALAVRAMDAQVGPGSLVRALVAVGAGASFEDAYAGLGTGSLAAFVSGFDAVKSAGGRIAVTQSALAGRDLGWTIYAFAPDTEVRVHISGGRAYDLVFTVTADDRGIFRGSFGSTAPAGAYTITATSGPLHASAQIVTAP